MKVMFLKFIMVLTLVLTNMSVSFSEVGCDHEESSAISTLANDFCDDKDGEENGCQDGDCICSLFCNNVVIEQNFTQVLFTPFFYLNSNHLHFDSIYPEIFLQLEKPPLV